MALIHCYQHRITMWLVCLCRQAGAAFGEAGVTFQAFCLGSDIPVNYYTTRHVASEGIGSNCHNASLRGRNTSRDVTITEPPDSHL